MTPKIKFGNLILETCWGNEAASESDLLLDGWRSVTEYRPGASVVIGSFIDFRACRHAWGDLLFENNCSIRGFIQAPAGYLRHYYCPIRIRRQRSTDPVLICGVNAESLTLCTAGAYHQMRTSGWLGALVGLAWATVGSLDKLITVNAFILLLHFRDVVQRKKKSSTTLKELLSDKMLTRVATRDGWVFVVFNRRSNAS